MADSKHRPASRRLSLSRRGFLSGSAALLASGGSGLLTACSGDSPAGNGQGRTPFTFLTILPPESLTFAPELFADAAGYFADQNLDVTLEPTRGSAQAIQLVLAERAPLTRISQIEGMRAAANRDAPLMNVGTVIKDSTIRYVSSDSDPLREPEDFVGKTVGIPSEGGSSELELDLFLAASGIDPDEVGRQVVGLSPGVFSLVEQGRIAGYAVSIDTAKILEQQQAGAVVFNPGDHMASGGQFYMTSRSSFDRDREAIVRYLEAIRAAIDFIIEDDGFDRTLEILRSKYSFDGIQDAAIARASLAEYVRAWTAGGRDNVLMTQPESWASGYDELVAAELAEPGADPGQWFTNELVERS